MKALDRSGFLALTAVAALIGPVRANVVLVQFNSTWKYLDNGSNQGTAWRAVSFPAEATWAQGAGELGYGDDDERTVVSYGPSATSKYITTYFRRTFIIADASQFSSYLMRFRRDDGIVVYMNGVEVARSNMPTGAIGYQTLASAAISGTAESTAISQVIASSFFQTGTNVLAVEVHQSAASSSDLTFDLQLTGVDGAPSLTRGPYLHITTPTSAVLKWRTDAPTNARVRYGTSPGALSLSTVVAAATLDHEVTVTGLLPGTNYYYAVGSTNGDLEGDDEEHFFRTSPPLGAQVPLRIWVVGDAGTATADQRRVRDAYLNHVDTNTAQAWLWLGDNAYQSGTEAEFQFACFENMYEPVLRNTTLWPAPGNHDYYSGASAATGTGPYFDLFAMPKLGQAGGVQSGTEAYYSFDIGNVHFISLDSYDSPRSPTGAMATWLIADLTLARKHAEWIITYWHHPPYTKGNHDSDNNSDPRSAQMRQNMLPILEAHGVDLVLGGHSHTYERSYMINGHHGLSSTFSAATMGINMTSGQASGPGAYLKQGDLAANAGAVHAVCGVSGKKEGTAPLGHPVMYYSTFSHLGSMVIDVNGTSLTARFINDHGVVVDHFDMVKGPTHIKLAARVFLEGAYEDSTGLMRDDLRAAGLIPVAAPHAGVFPIVGEGGTGVMAGPVLAVTGPDAIVDWVFVELRDKSDPATVVASRSALVQRDGDVVDLDGSSPLSFTMPVGAYHVAIRHRNHMGAMTADPCFIDRDPWPLDFTNSTMPTWGMNARKNMGPVMMLWAGNSTQDGLLRYSGPDNDRDPILQDIGGEVPTNTTTGYLRTDSNMNGEVKYSGPANDRDMILVNIGGTVPTNQLMEQLP
ncbi:MAG: metallophosphoesterase family protein [Flavobacteriales bacterium]|nr:metallophosphoesterase family protein [Flavobacteriales bacterium]